MLETFLNDRILLVGNIFEIRRQLIKYMNKYSLVQDLIKDKLQ